MKVTFKDSKFTALEPWHSSVKHTTPVTVILVKTMYRESWKKHLRLLSSCHGDVDNEKGITNEIEVKLQRRALIVIEAPTDNEDDDDLEYENGQWNGSDLGQSGV